MGRMLWTTAALQLKARRAGIQMHSIWGASLMNDEVGPLMFETFLPAALAERRSLAAPQSEVIGHGLGAIQQGFEVQRRGVSARKVVISNVQAGPLGDSPPQAPRGVIQTTKGNQMNQQKTFLVFGASGQTGQHFVSLALNEGHNVRALARNPAKLAIEHPNLDVRQGDITDAVNLDELLQGADFVISMLGNAEVQKVTKINTAFVQRLVPAMRRQGVRRFLYQAGGLSTPPNQQLPPVLWTIRNTVARGFIGQHKDNEAVMDYLVAAASDLEWMVHRAGIGSNGPSKGVLVRSKKNVSIATFVDCATYNYHTLMDDSAIHTCDLSCYQKG